MDLAEAIARRRMVRSFSDRPLEPGVLDRIVASAARAPTAGNTKGTAWVALEGPGETRCYWDAVTTPEWRERSSRWTGLSRAPAVLISLTSPDAYVARYGEPDKVASGLGPSDGHPDARAETAWPVPYWWGDAAFAVMHVLLAVVAEGLGACFLGTFRNEQALLDALGVPGGWRVFGAVALGHPDGRDHRSSSLDRPPPPTRRVHRGRWHAPER